MNTFIGLLLFAGLVAAIYYINKFLRRGATRLIQGGSYKLEKELTGQAIDFISSLDKETFMAGIKAHFPEPEQHKVDAGLKRYVTPEWVCEREDDMLVFTLLKSIVSAMAFENVGNGSEATFTIVEWVQLDGVNPNTKKMLELTETLQALACSLDPNVKVDIVPIS